MTGLREKPEVQTTPASGSTMRPSAESCIAICSWPATDGVMAAPSIAAAVTHAAATPVFLSAEVSLVICDATTAPPTVYAAVTGATAVAAGRSYMPGTDIFDAGTRSAAVGRKMIEKTRTSWAKPAAVARTFILTCGVRKEAVDGRRSAINIALTTNRKLAV